MTFPQSNSNTPALNGLDFFRLNQVLTCPGDCYESEQSGLAFAIGPDSDIANVVMNYFDPQVTATLMNQVVVSNRCPFIGRINARPELVYQPSNVPARIIFSPADIVPDLPLYTSNSPTMVIPPVMDVITYFSSPPAAIFPARNNRSYFLAFTPGSNPTSVYLPYYGRAFAQFQVFNDAGTTTTFALNGITYATAAFDSPIVTQIVGATAIGAGLNKFVRATVDGVFDYLRISFASENGNSITVKATFSDVVQ